MSQQPSPVVPSGLETFLQNVPGILSSIAGIASVVDPAIAPEAAIGVTAMNAAAGAITLLLQRHSGTPPTDQQVADAKQASADILAAMDALVAKQAKQA